MCGIPGSGKTTYLKNNTKVNNNSIVSRDAIRIKLLKEKYGEKYQNKELYFNCEKEVYKEFKQKIHQILNKYGKVFVDATNINIKSRKKLFNILPEDCSIILLFFNIKLEKAIERNAKRTGIERVPDKVITNMYQNLEPPTYSEDDRINGIWWVE